MQRYSLVKDKIPREVLLLKSYPCLYGKCSFCNYILDNSTSLAEIEATNYAVIEQLTGEFGVVEVLNSGSVFELPPIILATIKQKLAQLPIHTLYFETYYGYRKRLDEIRDYFSEYQVRFRIGIETFDDEFRERVLNKPFPTDNLAELAQQFHACCLLLGIKGQTKEQIQRDIQLARQYFQEITLNVFIDNGTAVKRDQDLVDWFVADVYPELKDVANIEILLDNKDLGVFVQ
ncbi:MAG: hypothetical protein RLZZ293_1446 [Pseudomonadota bacterium]|jgi:hypothetical protein